MASRFNEIQHLIRPHFRDMDGYVSAGMDSDKTADLLFLNANENPYELPGLEGANRYPKPQPEKLRHGLADFYGVKPEQLAITRGADEGIALLFRLFCEPDTDDILINPPTFGVYKVYAGAMPCRNVLPIRLLEADGTFKLDVESIKTALEADSHVKMIFLTNPNNPTGNTFNPVDIRAVIDAAAGKAIVVLDETYAEFKPDSSLVAELDTMPHVVILRTLSKSFALAGMRVGALISGVPALIETLIAKVMEVYPIPLASVEAALKVLSPDIMALAKDNIQKLIQERQRMEAFWKEQSFVRHVYPSDANFLLVKMDHAKAFAAHCRENGVILRDFSGDPLTPDCLRISIGTPDQNDLVIKLAEEFKL